MIRLLTITLLFTGCNFNGVLKESDYDLECSDCNFTLKHYDSDSTDDIKIKGF